MDKDQAFARLNQAVEYLKNKGQARVQNDMAALMGVRQPHLAAALNGDYKRLTEGFLRKFAAAYSDYINEDWLLDGKGQMEKADRKSTRPHIPADKAVVAAGFVGSAIGSVQESECEVRPVIAPLPWYDFTIEVSGDSMEPTLCSGDTIACEWLHDSTEFVRNRIYVLDTAEGAVVKRVERKGNTLHCHSDNLEYPDFDVPVDIVLRSARVVGLVRSL